MTPALAFAQAVHEGLHRSGRRDMRAPSEAEPAFEGWRVLADKALEDGRAGYAQGLRGEPLEAFVADQLTASWRREFAPTCSDHQASEVKANAWLPATRALLEAATAQRKRMVEKAA